MTSYEAFDGSFITLPERKPPSGPIPTWRAEDASWVSGTFKRFWKEALNRPWEPDGLAAVEKRFSSAKSRGLNTAEGFAAALNAADTPAGFWEVVEAPFGFWGPRLERLPPERQVVLRDLLMAYPPDRRVSLLAVRLWPRTKVRQWEALYTPVVDYFEQDYADLRSFEAGVPKITSPEAMTPELSRALAIEFEKLDKHFGGFLRHVHTADPQKKPWNPSAKSKPELSPSEEALLRTQSFLKAMRKVKPGIPGGHLMEVALTEKPAGQNWPNIRWNDFSSDAVWPYIASNIDILETALGAAEPLPWLPQMSPLKALKTLALLPKLPAQLVPAVEMIARSGTNARRAAARALLSSKGTRASSG